MSSTSSAPCGPVALDVRDVAVELGLELAPVHQAGQRVVVGHELQLRLEPLALGDVLELAQQALAAAGAPDAGASRGPRCRASLRRARRSEAPIRLHRSRRCQLLQRLGDRVGVARVKQARVAVRLPGLRGCPQSSPSAAFACSIARPARSAPSRSALRRMPAESAPPPVSPSSAPRMAVTSCTVPTKAPACAGCRSNARSVGVPSARIRR